MPRQRSSAIAVLLLLAACASAPAPDRSLRRERQQQDRIEAALAHAPQRLRDPALLAWLHATAMRIDPSAAELRIYVIDRGAPQADLISDQVLRVNLALLMALRDDDEATFVLAHELAHRELGHLSARHAPAWDAVAGEIAADRSAQRRLRHLGATARVGTQLLQRFAQDPRWQASAGVLQRRIAAMQADETMADASAPARAVAAGDRFSELMAPYRDARR